jgi:hypothetical protein
LEVLFGAKAGRLSYVVLTCFAVAATALDLVELFTMEVDPNRHVPFLFTGVFLALGGITWRIDRHWANLTPEQRQALDHQAAADSCLNPKNVTRIE